MAEEKNIVERARDRAKWRTVSSVLWTVFVFSLLSWACGFAAGSWSEVKSKPVYASVKPKSHMNRLQIFAVITAGKIHEFQSDIRVTKPEERVQVVMQPELPRTVKPDTFFEPEKPRSAETGRPPVPQPDQPQPADEPTAPEPPRADDPAQPEPPADVPRAVQPPIEDPLPIPQPKIIEKKSELADALIKANSLYDEGTKWYDLAGPTAPAAGRDDAARKAMKVLREAQDFHLNLLDSKKLSEADRVLISERLQAIQKMLYWTGKLGKH